MSCLLDVGGSFEEGGLAGTRSRCCCFESARLSFRELFRYFDDEITSVSDRSSLVTVLCVDVFGDDV